MTDPDMAAALQIDPSSPASGAAAKLTARCVNVYYGADHASREVEADIRDGEVGGPIWRSGCGTSAFLRCLNRMNDVIENRRATRDIALDKIDTRGRGLDVVRLRSRVGKTGGRAELDVIVIVTRPMRQAARVSQRTALFHLGELVEQGSTEAVFTNPRDQRTLDSVTGRFG